MFRHGQRDPLRGPRELTPDMRADAEHAGKFLRLFGGLWFGIGWTVGLVLSAVLGPIPLLGCSFFIVVGAVLYLRGRRQRSRRLALFQTGVECPGEIASVQRELHVRLNGRHPFRVRYRFTVDGQVKDGFDDYWTDDAPEATPGQLVSVLHGPEGNVLFTRVTLAPKLRVASAAREAAPTLADPIVDEIPAARTLEP